MNGHESSTDRPVAVDLFSGAGGMSLGFERAGFDVLTAIDADPLHLAVHERNFPSVHAVCADVAELTEADLHAAIRKGWALHGRAGQWNGEIDCIFGGPSCQGFSDMGHQRDDDKRNDLVFAFARIVVLLRPRYFVIENVPGILFEKVRPRLDRLCAELRSAGYVVDEPLRLDAVDFGVPQRRKRVFLRGSRIGQPKPSAPQEVGKVTVEEAIGDLPDIDTIEDLIVSDVLNLNPRQVEGLDTGASNYVRSLRHPSGREHPRSWDRTKLTGCRQTVHSPEVRARFNGLAPGEKDRTSRTARLDPSGYSMTLRAGAGRDHGSFTAPRPIHFEHARVVTVREAARLQSFPDWFDFHRTKWHALRQIGNSVPPRLAHAVAVSVLGSSATELSLPGCAQELGPDDLVAMSLLEAADHFGMDRALLPPDVRRAVPSSSPAAPRM